MDISVFVQGSCTNLDFRAGLEMTLKFANLNKSPRIVFEYEKVFKSLEFSSRANQTSGGSRLKVDNC